ncbi:MAG TPA: HAMP domain-containing sensor histidine kinase [Gemmatimonadaceae bacterium]|jgi:signal transduction histidine kinase|nr:HAMP domain-containing sensor histidine kinase [Gemmatimonadaceae bacterium]
MHAFSQLEIDRWTGLVGWIISLATVLGLALVLRHERRQARSLVERSKELERLSSELLRVNRMKSEFLANVSHELRTPLNAIVGFVDLLREGVYGDLAPRQVKPVERIEASANHLRHLVDQVLDLAKMAAGRLEIHTETIDLRPFVLDVASEIESLVSEKGLSLSLVMGAALPRIRTDPTHLRQILMNLLGNAVKYTNEGGIVIRTRLVDSLPDSGQLGSTQTPSSNERVVHPPTTQWIGIQVIDTGIGIDPSDQTRIFEEFEQIDAGPRGNSAERGTGLGLPISRRLAALIGGIVELESELGKGSTFTLWLPVDPEESAVTTK